MTINKHSLEKSGLVAVEGGSIHYRYYEPHNAEAATQTPLIVIHGGPGASHASMYAALAPLADERPVVFYDQLGSHFSPAEMTPELMRVDRFVDEVPRLMAALGLERASLLGHSWGGVIAIECALQHPEKVDRLILSAPLISTTRWIEDCNRLLDDLPADMQQTIRRCEAEGTTGNPEYKAADAFFSARHFCRQTPLPEALIKHRSKLNWQIYSTMWGPSEFTCQGSLANVDLFPHLNEITAPTLFVCGQYDTAAPSTMQDAQEKMQDAGLIVIPDSGHVMYLDNNAAYLQAVSGFLIDEPVRPKPSAVLKFDA